MERFWLVWCVGGGVPVYQHASEAGAREEAGRLARLNPGRVFAWLEFKGAVVKRDLEEIPVFDSGEE